MNGFSASAEKIKISFRVFSEFFHMESESSAVAYWPTGASVFNFSRVSSRKGDI